MPAVDSRVKQGILRLEGATAGSWEDFSCQPTAVSIRPGTETEDTLEVLCGDNLGGLATNTATLVIEAVSDFLNCNGLIAYSWKNAGKVRKFEFTPDKSDSSHVWSGSVNIVPIEVGGEVNARITASVEWELASLLLPTCYGGTWYIGSGPSPAGVVMALAGGVKEHMLQPVGAAKPKDLAALKADPVIGDSGSAKPSGDFGTGEFVTLADGSKAHYTVASGWAAGAKP